MRVCEIEENEMTGVVPSWIAGKDVPVGDGEDYTSQLLLIFRFIFKMSFFVEEGIADWGLNVIICKG